MNQKHRSHVIVCSDRASEKVYEDHSGPAGMNWLESHNYICLGKSVIADDTTILTEAILELIDRLDLIVVIGGTGLGPRDITPQTVSKLADYEVPGFGELMRRESEKYSLNAHLSRCGAYVKGSALILSLPGNPKAAVEQLDILSDLIPNAICAIRGECKHRHRLSEVQNDFV